MKAIATMDEICVELGKLLNTQAMTYDSARTLSTAESRISLAETRNILLSYSALEAQAYEIL